MKIKNILVLFVGVFSLGFLVNCDGGSSSTDIADGEGDQNSVTIPTDTDIVNDVNDGRTDDSGADESLEQLYATQIFNGINSDRASRSLPALIRSSLIDDLAASHNSYLISIANPGGSIVTNHDNVQGRADVVFSNGFNSYGENTAGIRGYGSGVVAVTFVQGWINSPGHLSNIAGDYTHSGVAVAVDERDGTIFATQIFSK